jgi:glycosyltransferase involved in cell wall biosynthesis
MRRALVRAGFLVWEVDYIAGDSIADAAGWWRPDIVLTELHDVAHLSFSQTLRMRMNLPNSYFINWHGDYWPNMASDPAAHAVLRLFDLNTVVNMDMAPLFEEAGVTTRYWQIGYEEHGVGYDPLPSTPSYDVLFLGAAYSYKRKALGAFLRGLKDVKVGLYGHGWPQPDGETTYDFIAGCRLIRNAKLVIADSQWPEAKGYCSNRTIQSLAAGGALLLQQAFAGMEELVGIQDGVHCVTWEHFDELAAKIAFYLTHEEERARIARQGHALALERFSFDARLRELWGMLRELYDEEPGVQGQAEVAYA